MVFIVNAHIVDGQKGHSSGVDRRLNYTQTGSMLDCCSHLAVGRLLPHSEEPVAGVVCGDFNIASQSEFENK